MYIIQSYWLSKFKKIHPKLLAIYNKVEDNPEMYLDGFATGQTNLIPKKSQTEVPSNYFPITSLPITYKILSSKRPKE